MLCPEVEELRLYYSGELNTQRNHEVAQHVKSCLRCQKICDQWELSSEGFSFIRVSSENISDDFFNSLDRYTEEYDNTSSQELHLPPELISYHLEGKIGEGGMGDVYSAQQKYLKRKVAVKFIRRSKISPEAVERFQKEMEIVGRLSDPHIVTAYDAGEINGMPFLVMEFLEGETLQDKINRDGKLLPMVALDYMIQTTYGLITAHEANIIHRDIKPGNLWLDKKGNVKILDLGLAQIYDNSDEKEQDISGTPDFMAPEQCIETTSVDSRADLYAMGCTLFYLITGCVPYPTEKYSTTQQKLNAQLFTPLPRLKDVLPKCFLSKYERNRWQTVLDKLTAKNPDMRYLSATEALAVLNRLKIRNSTLPMILAGYMFSTLCLLIFPVLFAIIGLIIAHINRRRGSSGHAFVQTVFSIVFGLIGCIIGCIVWQDVLYPEDLEPIYKRDVMTDPEGNTIVNPLQNPVRSDL